MLDGTTSRQNSRVLFIRLNARDSKNYIYIQMKEGCLIAIDNA